MDLFHDVKLGAPVAQFGLAKGATGAIIGVRRAHRRVYTVEFPSPHLGTASTMLDLDADAFDSDGEAIVVAGWRQPAAQMSRES